MRAPTSVETQLLSAARVDEWPGRKTLFHEGDAPRDVHVVVSGEIDLIFSARRGTQKTLRVARAGEVLGLGDVVAGTPHDCTAATRTAATIGTLSVNELHRLLEDDPSLWLAVLQFLSNDVNACYDSMRCVAALR